jgi:hypothetical protein
MKTLKLQAVLDVVGVQGYLIELNEPILPVTLALLEPGGGRVMQIDDIVLSRARTEPDRVFWKGESAGTPIALSWVWDGGAVLSWVQMRTRSEELGAVLADLQASGGTLMLCAEGIDQRHPLTSQGEAEL